MPSVLVNPSLRMTTDDTTAVEPHNAVHTIVDIPQDHLAGCQARRHLAGMERPVDSPGDRDMAQTRTGRKRRLPLPVEIVTLIGVGLKTILKAIDIESMAGNIVYTPCRTGEPFDEVDQILPVPRAGAGIGIFTCWKRVDGGWPGRARSLRVS
jgi:hypothetical protein